LEQGLEPVPARRPRREAVAPAQPGRGAARGESAQEADQRCAGGDRGSQGRVPRQGRGRAQGMSLEGRELILGVTGSIAAYKAVYLLRELTRLGASVSVCLSEHAREFVGALTFRTLSGRPVLSNLFDPQSTDAVEHVALAERCHAVVVAPATANVLAKAAHGIADDFLTTLLLAARAPVLMVPAMDGGMWDHPAVAANVVTLLSGPTALTPPPGAVFVPVQTAEDMREAVLQHLDRATIVVKAAAVADYRTKQASSVKIKGKRDLTLELTPNPDILAEVAARGTTAFVVGFAAETHDVAEHARAKLESKGIDLLVANDVSQQGIGFDAEDNEVLLLDRWGGTRELPRMPKAAVADAILSHVLGLRAGITRKTPA